MSTHREAVPLLPDLLESRLDREQAAALWSHVAECEECQQVVTAMHQVRVAVEAGGTELFSGHPVVEDLVRFALVDPDLPTVDLARLGDHVRGCAECRDAVELTRRAERGTGKTPFLGALGGGNAFPAAAAASAAFAVILAYPAYLGLVELPGAQRARHAALDSVAALETRQQNLTEALASRERAPAPVASWAGPARLLFLPATTRGEEAAVEVVLDPAQLYQPIVIAHRPFEGPRPEGMVEIAIAREPHGTAVWSERRQVEELWDPAHASLVVLVPAAALAPGTYRLEVRRDGVAGYSAAFRARARKKS